jgi:hypothetical protein
MVPMNQIAGKIEKQSFVGEEQPCVRKLLLKSDEHALAGGTRWELDAAIRGKWMWK